MGISPNAIGIRTSVVLFAVAVFCASSAMAQQQYEVPNCVHKSTGSHHIYQEVAAESVFAPPNPPLVLQAKQIKRGGGLSSDVKPNYVVIAQWPKPGDKIPAGDPVDIIVIDNSDHVDDFKKTLILIIGAAVVVGLVAGLLLSKLKKPDQGTITREARNPSA